MILSRVERQHVHANVTENWHDVDEEETIIKEEMSTNSRKPQEELYINDDETNYDPETIQELFRENFVESYEFVGFEKEKTHQNSEIHLIANRIKAVIEDAVCRRHSHPTLRMLNGGELRSKSKS